MRCLSLDEAAARGSSSETEENLRLSLRESAKKQKRNGRETEEQQKRTRWKRGVPGNKVEDWGFGLQVFSGSDVCV